MSSCKTWLKALGLTLALVCAAAPSRAVDQDKLVPGDAEMVLVVNLRQLLGSPLVKKYGLEQMKEALKSNDQAQRMLNAAGLDPFTDVDRVIVTKASGGNDRALVVVRGRFDQEKVHTAATDFAEKNPGELKITTEEGVRIYELKTKDKEKPGFAAFADKSTLVVSPSKEYTLETVKNGGKESVKLNKKMAAALEKIGGNESVWWAVVVTGEMRKAMHKNPNPQAGELADKLEAITGYVDVTRDVKVNVQIHTADEETAAKVKEVINQFKPILTALAAQAASKNEDAGTAVEDLVKGLKITSSQGTVTLRLEVPADLIDKLAEKQK